MYISALSVLSSVFLLFFTFGFSQKLYIVTSGSMEPVLTQGSIVFIWKTDSYEIGDIITFKNADNTIVTHRVVDKEDEYYLTRGDANAAADKEVINNTDILGKKTFAFPFVGKAVLFAKRVLPVLS